MSGIAPLSPSTRAALRRYRLLARESVQPNPTGGQLMRRKGQSLEFREHLPYLPGDDIRFVDWRASARHGTKHDLLARSFVAEERMRLLLSLDPRATMALPEALPKLQFALWIAEALLIVAGAEDELLLHWLFDRSPSPPRPLQSLGQLYGQRAVPAGLGEDAPVNLQHVRPFLPPTTVWVIVTDLYFDHSNTAKSLAAAMVAATSGMCWVLLIELDSWAQERTLMGQEVWHIDHVASAPLGELVQLSDPNLQEVERRIAVHRAGFVGRTRLAAEDHLLWPLPAGPAPEAEHAFLSTFTSQGRIQALFAKQNV